MFARNRDTQNDSTHREFTASKLLHEGQSNTAAKNNATVLAVGKFLGRGVMVTQ